MRTRNNRAVRNAQDHHGLIRGEVRMSNEIWKKLFWYQDGKLSPGITSQWDLMI